MLLVALVSAAPQTEPAEAATIAPGTSRKIVLDERAGSFRRSFRLHVPAGAGGDTPRPLVLALHGGFATARILEQQTGLSGVADRNGFLVAFPNGLGIFSLARHWNGGYCCAKARDTGLDDLGFLDRVTEWIAERYPVDRERIYVIGYSNGGMLAHWYAAERAERLAGLGIWASSIGSFDDGETRWSWPPPTAALPVFVAHGLDDARLPFHRPAEREGQQLLGAVGSAEAWARANGCSRQPAVETRRQGAVEQRAWCAAGPTPVVLLALAGWGHDWPGPRQTSRLPSEHPLKGFHLAEEMWRFFSQLPAPTPTPAPR